MDEVLVIVMWALVVSCVVLTVADIYTTNRIIKEGGTELNSVIAFCMHVLGSFWWVPKVIVLALMVLAAMFAASGWLVLGLGFGAAVLAYAVVHNLGQL